MVIKTTFLQNYLSKEKIKAGKFFAIGLVLFSGLLSHIYWNSDIGDVLEASKKNIFQEAEYYRLFTTSFIHGDLKHYLSNSLMLFILSYFVSSFYGKTFTFFLSLLGGALINFTVLKLSPTPITLVGASGIVYLLWGFWLTLYSKLQTQLSPMSRFLRVGAITLILLVPTSYSPQVSYSAHFFGLVFGIISAVIYYFFYKSHLKSFENWDVKINLDELIPDESHNDFTRVE